MSKRVFLALFLLSAGLFYTVCGCGTTPQSSPKLRQVGDASTMLAGYPKGYQNWTNTTSRVVLNKTSPFYGFQRVFVSKQAMDAYRNIGPYPRGARLVLEFNEPVKKGEDIVKGHVNWLAVMTKDPSATQTGGWIYEAYDGNPNVAIKKDINPVTDCYNCHMAMKCKDYVFSSISNG